MKLLKLSANKESFHTISFNKTGVSLIVAKKRTENERDTYNSVGKSLSIALIHFCLASNKIPAFEEQLADWEFYLDFEINGKEYTSKRRTNNQTVIFLNDVEMTLADFRTNLADKAFGIATPVNYLTFRTLISRFIRPKRSSYDLYSDFIKEEEDYPRLLNNSYLLGLDIRKVIKKCELKEEFDLVKDIGAKIQKDPVMKSFFLKDGASENVEIKIVELERKISRLQANIDGFVIAEDYNEIKKDADSISNYLRDLRNQAAKIRIAVESLGKSLKVKPDITHEQLKDFYAQAQIQLSDMVVKKIEDVEAFNAKILDNRTVGLLREKRNFENQLSEIESKITHWGHLEDEKLQYLNSHGALDDYTQLTNLLAENKMNLLKFQQYKQLVKEYKTRQEEVKKNFADENIATVKYLSDIEPLVKKNILIFQTLSEQFYEGKSSGITIENNEKQNKLRFDIKAKIEDDTGDGVNGVRTFCFDWTLLKGQYNHNVKFIFHDSRLISENDPRQVATMLKIAYHECQKNDFQYILSINQSTLDLLQKELSEEEYKTLVVDTEVLELNDISDEHKLLGIQLDLNYTKE
ncbi:MAG: DUF2326 domain-containing protein [Tannerella sp.]|jgi:uncharacterized protein YydD (DUF2326 family)|nr:DUF2326 domain-containing protein [Tannerella sp.]